jgi:Mn-dependent DtxR family transcriptional regulator
MPITESSATYLRTILTLSQHQDKVFSIDIANTLHYNKSSVCIALKKLRSQGFLSKKKDGSITLTCSGKCIAKRIIYCQQLFAALFHSLGIETEALRCQREWLSYGISEQTCKAIKNYLTKNTKQESQSYE